MKSQLVKVIAQETRNSATEVDVFVWNLQKNLDKLLKFETRVSKNTNDWNLVEIFYQEDTDDNSISFKVVSFNFKND